MKAVIVEIQKKYAIALDKNGSFIKIKNNGKLRIGYEIEVPAAVINFNRRYITRIASIAAMFILVLGASYGAYSYNQPYSFVDVDINPSIELTVNRFDRIIKAEGINQDGKDLLDGTSYKNKSLKSGIEGIIMSATDSGYIKENENNAVMFTISTVDDKKNEKIENEVKNAAANGLSAINPQTDVLVEKVSNERHSEALNMGITPGKLILIEKLVNYEPEKKVEDLKKLSVKDIMKSVIANKKSDNEDEKQKNQNVSENNKQDIVKPEANAKVQEKDNVNNDKASEKTTLQKQDNKGNEKLSKDINIETVDEYIKNEVNGRNNSNRSNMQKDKEVDKQENNGKNNQADKKEDKKDDNIKGNQEIKDKNSNEKNKTGVDSSKKDIENNSSTGKSKK